MCTDDAACCVFDAKPHRQLAPIPDDHHLSAMALAQFYGFLRHRRVYVCAIDGEPIEPSRPSRIEDLLGDG